MPRYAAIAVLALGADYAEAWSANGLRLAARQRAAPAQMAIAVDEKSEPLKFVTLKNSKGDSAKLYHFGACATSYVKGGVESLAVRPDAKMDGSKPISGGIPFCFPQFGPGVIQQHGFARNVDWTLAESTDGDEPSVTFTLEPTDYTKAMWDYPFACKYSVTLKADRLATEFSVSNTGTAGSFDFAAALHTCAAGRAGWLGRGAGASRRAMGGPGPDASACGRPCFRALFRAGTGPCPTSTR